MLPWLGSMVSETVIAAIMAASVTGAGLVIAFYALIARMSDRIFSNRLDLLDKPRREIREITSNPESFNEENLDKTTKRLEELGNQVNSMKTYPRYLGLGVGLDFGFFLSTAIFALLWFTEIFRRSSMTDLLVSGTFLLAISTFLVVGIYGISDVDAAMNDNFSKLKEKKENLKDELKEAPQEAKITGRVAQFLIEAGVAFRRDVMFKTDGDRVFVDFLIGSEENPKYAIEVLTEPTKGNVLIPKRYDLFKALAPAKTVLISDFSKSEPLQEIAKVYWDFVVDVKSLDELKKIIKT